MRGVRGSQVTAQGRCLPAGGGDLVETGGQAEYPLGVSGGLTSRGAVCTGRLGGPQLSWSSLHWASLTVDTWPYACTKTHRCATQRTLMQALYFS